mmetsp:Transcript_19739/g.16906  ORF Transcript_19739/g.16906 Transcript_19739/m.16906 type:complete len:97 (+) Transcript_19739:255-545(+)
MKFGFEVKLLSEKKWDNQILNGLKLSCNRDSRTFYEFAKPSWYLTPFENDSAIIREYYIREKYVHKEFLKKNDAETEESVYKKMISKVEDIEKKKS